MTDILFMIENTSAVIQDWTVEGVGGGTINPNHFKSADLTYEINQNLRVGITIDVGDDQIATQLRRDAGVGNQFYLYPASHEFVLQQDINTLHISSSYSGEHGSGFKGSFPREEKPSTELQTFILSYRSPDACD